MNNTLPNLIKKKSYLILPFLLSVILSSAVFSVYMVELFSFWTVGIILMTTASFILCEFVNKHHFIGGVVFVVLFFAAVRLFFSLTLPPDWGETFRQWFLTGAEKAETKSDYLYALLISFVPFFSVVVYYFTVSLYRMSFLTLASVIPFALYAKVLSNVDNFYLCLIAMLNVAIFMMISRKKHSDNSVVIGQNSGIMSGLAFTFILLVISSVIPKEQDARYYDRFEDLFLNANNNRPVNSQFQDFSEFSGNAEDFTNFDDRRLYTVYGPTAPYVKRQVFDLYDYENGYWYPIEEYSSFSNADEDVFMHRKNISLALLQKAIIAADVYSEEFAEKYNMTTLTGFDGFREDVYMLTVVSENFGPRYFISPARAFEIRMSSNNPEQNELFVTRHGIFRRNDSPHPPYATYYIYGYEEYISRSLWFSAGGASADDETCAQMLSEMSHILSDNNDPLAEVADDFLSVHNDAMHYKELTAENGSQVSDRIVQLAEEITAGCTYDYEKANELQRYFIKNNFRYDLQYVENHGDTEKFLFDSKRGSCSDYATAYVKMARAVGLTVRYCEGFTMDDTSRENTFVINDNNSHAYPEVYIQNMGWIVFEPTVASQYMNGGNTGGTDFNVAIDYDLMFSICIITAALILLGICIMVVMPYISEKVFLMRVRKADNENAVKMVYNALVRKKAPLIVRHPQTLTPFELADAMHSKTGCDISSETYALEQIIYAEGNSDDSIKEAALKAYTDASAAVKEYRKRSSKERRESEKERRNRKKNRS